MICHLKNFPVYKKAHYFLQVGTKHVVSMELQIFNSKDGRSWFHDQQLSTVIGYLQGELMARIDRKCNDMDIQIVEDDSLLMVYKFRPNGGRDSIILHKRQMEAAGLTSTLPTYGNGDYAYMLLCQEKLIISVSLLDQCEDLLNLTEANVEDIGSNYFNDTKKTTNSEQRKKNTLKKIWSTRNRLNVRRDILHECSAKQNLESEDVTTESNIISFKEKISVYGHKKSGKDTLIDMNVPKHLPGSPSGRNSNNTNIPYEKVVSEQLSKKNDQDRVATTSSCSNTCNDVEITDVIKVSGELSDKGNTVKLSETENIILNDKDIYTENGKDAISNDNSVNGKGKTVLNAKQKRTVNRRNISNSNKSVKHEGKKEIDCTFSDNEDFSAIKIKRKKRRLYTDKSKKRKKDDLFDSPFVETVEESTQSQESEIGSIKTRKNLRSTGKTMNKISLSDRKREELSAFSLKEKAIDNITVNETTKMQQSGCIDHNSKQTLGNLSTFESKTISLEKKKEVFLSLSEKAVDESPAGKLIEPEESQLESPMIKRKCASSGSRISENNNEVSLQKITMEDLLKSKEHEVPSEPTEKIHTLVADQTIDLDEYGNVSFEDVHSVRDLTVEQIRDLVRNMEVELRNIFRGEAKCKRHDLFNNGGLDKATLNMRVAFGLFSEEQENMISDTLVEMFCPKKVKYFDYVMKVLLPETMAMLYAKVAKISQEDAEKFIMERC